MPSFKDDDIVTSSIYSSFQRLEDSVPKGQSLGVYVKLETESHFIHMWKQMSKHEPTSISYQMFVYFIEDKNMSENVIRPFMEKTLKTFMNTYGHRIDELKKSGDQLREFDSVVEKILGNLREKQYLRFFRMWDKPRLKKR